MNPIIKPISVILKEARKNKGLSLDEIYRATKIHPKILRSLEEGTTLGLSHVYVRGYIRIYAKYLGINQEELDKYFRPVVVQKEKKSYLDFSFRTKGDKIGKLFNVYSLNKLRFQIKHYKKIVVISVVFFALALLGLSKCSHRKESISQLKESVSQDSSSVLRPEETTKQEKESPFPQISDVLRLTIFTEEDNWMQIKADGKVVFKRILKKSTSETWQAKESFNLWLANAGIIKLELNGKILEPIGRRGQLLKDVVITREGITINR